MKICRNKTCSTEKAVVRRTSTRGCRAEKKDVTFTVHADRGKEVYLTGEFNGWDPTAKKMAYKARKGLYTATIKLPVGDYQYKFVIDGTWCADPENANAVPNDQGTFNSLVSVK